MGSRRSQLRLWGRCTLLALLLGAGAVSGAPVLAQQGPLPSFTLQLESPPNSSSRALTLEPQGGADNSSRCLGDERLGEGLRARGFADIDIRGSLGAQRVAVQGRYEGWIYRMSVDRCSGDVSAIERVRRATGGDFGLHFQYDRGR